MAGADRMKLPLPFLFIRRPAHGNLLLTQYAGRAAGSLTDREKGHGNKDEEDYYRGDIEQLQKSYAGGGAQCEYDTQVSAGYP